MDADPNDVGICWKEDHDCYNVIDMKEKNVCFGYQGPQWKKNIRDHATHQYSQDQEYVQNLQQQQQKEQQLQQKLQQNYQQQPCFAIMNQTYHIVKDDSCNVSKIDPGATFSFSTTKSRCWKYPWSSRLMRILVLFVVLFGTWKPSTVSCEIIENDSNNDDYNDDNENDEYDNNDDDENDAIGQWKVQRIRSKSKRHSYNKLSKLESALNRFCLDLRSNCAELAELGACKDDKTVTTAKDRWVSLHCPKSCGTCSEMIRLVSTVKGSNKTINMAPLREKPSKILSAYGADLGVPQIVPESRLPSKFSLVTSTPATNSDDYRKIMEPEVITEWLDEARNYVWDVVNVEERFREVRDQCRNNDSSCLVWAVDGWCTGDAIVDEDSDEAATAAHYEHVQRHCGPLCGTCHLLHITAKCPLPHVNDVVNAWHPGDLDRMFERIISNDEINILYDVTIISRPSSNISDTTDQENSNINEMDGPWIIQVDDFFNATEAARLIELGEQAGYERSTDLGRQLLENGHYENKISDRRTSSNAWCTAEECRNDPVVQAISKRIEQLIGLDGIMENAEAFQLLRYEHGQYYKQHHDYIHQDYDRVHGVRVLTVFLYLNTIDTNSNLGVLTSGGGTKFSRLYTKQNLSTRTKPPSVTIQPKLGRALIWPSVLNDQPHEKDIRTMHEALPLTVTDEVISNDITSTDIMKYAANVWIHQRPIQRECL